jgi:hypothetical protein
LGQCETVFIPRMLRKTGKLRSMHSVSAKVPVKREPRQDAKIVLFRLPPAQRNALLKTVN